MGRGDDVVRVIALLGAACAVSACAAPLPPTYVDDVAPIVARSCMPCHDGRGLPPSLATYADVKAQGEAAPYLVEIGYMPPGGVDTSGACGDFAGPTAPTAAQLATWRAWLEHGAIERAPSTSGRRTDDGRHDGADGAAGAAAAPTPAAAFVATTTIALPVHVPAADASGTGEHRCFLVDAPAEAPTFLAAFRVVPGARELVHHAMLFALPDDGDVAHALSLDAADAVAGWSCAGTPRVPGATLVGAWVPGRDVVAFPDGTGAPLPPRPLVVQLHYDGAVEPREDRTTIELALVDDVARPLRFVPIAAPAFALPPGQDEVLHQETIALGETVDVVGVMPHMHALGRALRLTADACLVDAPAFDYGFQQVLFYEAPVRLDAGTSLTLSCAWDTSAETTVTTWGERSEDEMCMVFLVVAAPA